MGIRQAEIINAADKIGSRAKVWITAVLCLLFVCACSSSKPPRWDEVERSKEFYNMPSRKYAPEPVYGRMTWSHLPEPQVQKNKDDAPLIDPTFSFEMPNSNLTEALEALSQAIGYRWKYPQRLGHRKISINRVGTVSEILSEICSQAHVRAALDNAERIIYVQDANLRPNE